jgi:hypothetical protein
MSAMMNMSQMFFNGNNSISARVVSRAPAPVSSESAPRSAPAPLIRMRGRAPMISLGNIMTHNTTPCRSCGH